MSFETKESSAFIQLRDIRKTYGTGNLSFDALSNINFRTRSVGLSQ
jgi:hypothetical protein